MTPEDVRQNKAQMKCFWCQSALSNFATAKYIIICEDNGEVICIARAGDSKASPLVYCSSDCMVYESHLRYCDRVKRGTFRKAFDIEYGGDTHQYISKAKTPSGWQEEGEVIIGAHK